MKSLLEYKKDVYKRQIEYITTPELIEEKFGKEVELIIDGGIGNIEPSTIVNCTSGEADVYKRQDEPTSRCQTTPSI